MKKLALLLPSMILLIGFFTCVSLSAATVEIDVSKFEWVGLIEESGVWEFSAETLTIQSGADVKVVGGTFEGIVKNNGTISGGTFTNEVNNYGTISDGTFYKVLNHSGGKITGGMFSGFVENKDGGVINGGTFTANDWPHNYMVNYGTISDGMFSGYVSNKVTGKILGGTFNGIVSNKGAISAGTFNGTINTPCSDNNDYTGATVVKIHADRLITVDEVPATCTATGVEKHYKCPNCGTLFSDESGTTVVAEEDLVIDILSHTVGTPASCTAKAICADCNQAYGEFALHSWDNGTITKEPTRQETGVRTYECTVCHTTKTETIPKLTGGGTVITFPPETTVAPTTTTTEKETTPAETSDISLGEGVEEVPAKANGVIIIVAVIACVGAWAVSRKKKA